MVITRSKSPLNQTNQNDYIQQIEKKYDDLLKKYKSEFMLNNKLIKEKYSGMDYIHESHRNQKEYDKVKDKIFKMKDKEIDDMLKKMNLNKK